jgi:hypothetical protein
MYIIDSIAAKSQKHEETEGLITISYLKNGFDVECICKCHAEPAAFLAGEE